MTRLNKYVKIAEAAGILGVSQNTVRALGRSRQIPIRRNPANGYRLFDGTWIVSWPSSRGQSRIEHSMFD
jgi:hypothetical protein